MNSEADPQVQELLEVQASANLPPLDAMSIEEMRRRMRAINEGGETESVGGVTDLSIEGRDSVSIPLRIYEPGTSGPHPVVVFYHGGGWVVGDLETHDNICRSIVNESGCIVVAVDYRRAPEHPFPAAVEDSYDALEWVNRHAESLGGDSKRLAVAGDSSGGALAAAMCLLARGGDVALSTQVLIYPVTNYQQEMPSYEENSDVVSREDSNWFKHYYLASPIDGYNPCAFPLEASDLSDLPPAMVLTCEFDPLRDEGVAYANRLSEAGVTTSHHHYEGMIHAFLNYESLDRRETAIADIATHLRDRLGE